MDINEIQSFVLEATFLLDHFICSILLSSAASKGFSLLEFLQKLHHENSAGLMLCAPDNVLHHQ